jgi:hypothetical protein
MRARSTGKHLVHRHLHVGRARHCHRKSKAIVDVRPHGKAEAQSSGYRMGSRAGDEQTGKDVADPQEGCFKARIEFAHEASGNGACSGPCPGPGPTGRSVPMAGPAADALAPASPSGVSDWAAPATATRYCGAGISFPRPCRDNPPSFLYGSVSGQRTRHRE